MTAIDRPTSHPFNMHRHIHEQPDAIAAAVARNHDGIANFANTVATLDRLYVVGIGTSYHATLMMEYFMRAFGGGMTTIAVHAFDFVLYGPELTERDAVIVISHTGRKSYAADAIERVKASPAALAVVTGGEGAGRLAGMEHLFETVPPEGSSTYTVSYTSALGVLAATAAAIGAARSGKETLAESVLTHDLPQAQRGALETEAQVKDLAEAHTGHRKIWLAGAGAAGVSAAEVALKIKEASYFDAEGMSTEQMLHGPFQSVEPGDLMVLLVPEGPGQARTLDLAAETKEIGLDLIVISDGSPDSLRDQADGWVVVPSIREPFSALTTLVPAQLLAYWLSLARGTNPDRFRLDDERFARAYALTKL
jgi:glucosamine--fructose-6-phosphate aminotransferase (isomerizing)